MGFFIWTSYSLQAAWGFLSGRGLRGSDRIRPIFIRTVLRHFRNFWLNFIRTFLRVSRVLSGVLLLLAKLDVLFLIQIEMTLIQLKIVLNGWQIGCSYIIPSADLPSWLFLTTGLPNKEGLLTSLIHPPGTKLLDAEKLEPWLWVIIGRVLANSPLFCPFHFMAPGTHHLRLTSHKMHAVPFYWHQLELKGALAKLTVKIFTVRHRTSTVPVFQVVKIIMGFPGSITSKKYNEMRRNSSTDVDISAYWPG